MPTHLHVAALVIGAALTVAIGSGDSDQQSVASDARLKANVRDLPEDTLDKVLGLRGRNFEFTRDAQRRNLGEAGLQTGFIAQEVRVVFPDWVAEGDDGYLYIKERGTTALLVEALRQLRAEKDEAIKKLNDQVKTLNDASIVQTGLIIELGEDIKALKNANNELRSKVMALEEIVGAGGRPGAGATSPVTPIPKPDEP